MFNRRSSDPEPSAATTGTPTVGSGKGRPTPSRKNAEAARRAAVKPATTGKHARRADREARRLERARSRGGLLAGDEKHLPARDRGPVRAFVRDYVDARRTAAEFFLPLLLIILVMSFTPYPALTSVVWFGVMLLVFLDTTVLAFRLRAQVRRRFPDDPGRGNVLYAIGRASQIRRLRLPRPRVRPGATV